MSSIPGNGGALNLSSDPADLFVQLYDLLDPEALADPNVVAGWLDDSDIRNLSEELEHEALHWGLDPGEIGPRVRDGGPEVLVAHLIGLERALRQAHPLVRSPDANQIATVAVRYRTTGKLSTEAVRGALLPRFARGREIVTPYRPSDLFEDLVRVPEEQWIQATHSVVASSLDVLFTPDSPRIGVATAPLLEDLTEMEVEVVERGGARAFRLKPRSGVVEKRMKPILEQMDGSGCRIGFLPEATLSMDLLETWISMLRKTAPSQEDGLDWILVGTGPITNSEPPDNTAVLLDRRTGEVILKQAKMHPFVLTSEQLKRWGLRDALGRKPIQEDLQRGTSVHILESCIGRIAVLICEDLSRVMTLGPVLMHHGVSILMAPIFSEPIEPWHWEHVKAKDFLEEIGTSTVVSNSLVIANNIDAKDPGTALRVSPGEEHDLVRSSTATDVGAVIVAFRGVR